MKFDVVVVVMFLSGVDILLIWQTSLIYIHTYIYTYIHTYLTTYLPTYIHTYTHTHINTHTCMYTCVRVFVAVCCFTGIYMVWTCANVWSLRTNRHVR